jgi:hypothetical protein
MASNRGWRIWMPKGRRALAPLAGAMALVAQLILAPLHPAIASPRSDRLAELAALTGQQLVLCEHAAGDLPSAPDHSGCDGSTLCCQLSHSIAATLAPPPSLVLGVLRQAVRLRPSATISLHAYRRSLSSLPRGPPQTA